jgi:hypothetical protein
VRHEGAQEAAQGRHQPVAASSALDIGPLARMSATPRRDVESTQARITNANCRNIAVDPD